MHPFKKEKRLNSSQFTPAAGFLGIIIIILPFLRDNGRPKIEKGVIKSVRGGHNIAHGKKDCNKSKIGVLR